MSRCRLLVVGVALGVAVLPAGPAHAKKTKAFGERPLRQGMRGPDVRTLQVFLTRVGLRTTADGVFGPYTAGRVRTWEARSQRRVDGRMGKRDARVLSGQVASGTRLDVPPAPTAEPATETAVLTPDGRAVAPASAPAEVHAVIAAANRIVGKPYKYGGGHGKWEDSGYDCSGSMSYALHGGGFLERALTSSDFARWGEPGPGTWITTYGHSGHSFMVVAGLRFDTGYHNSGRGPRWSDQMRPSTGYSVRHPAGF